MTRSTMNTRRISRHLAAVAFVWATIGASRRARRIRSRVPRSSTPRLPTTMPSRSWMRCIRSRRQKTRARSPHTRCSACVALGKNDQAKLAIETIVKTDPLYHPSEVQVSPRIRNFFETARRPLLVGVLKQSYTKAKQAYDKKDMAEASKGLRPRDRADRRHGRDGRSDRGRHAHARDRIPRSRQERHHTAASTARAGNTAAGAGRSG